MTENFRLMKEWFTVPQFAEQVPLCMYHKENESSGREGSASLPENLHVLVRSDVIIDKKADRDGRKQKYILRITADDYYKLYINGKFTAQGPAPAYPEHYYYNEMDITGLLQEGRNVLAVHLYYQGLVNRVWNSGDGRFGLACEIINAWEGGCDGTDGKRTGENGEKVIIPEWRYRISEAYSGGTTGYDTQFLENFDSRKWQDDWNRADFDDSGWEPVVRAAWADYTFVPRPAQTLEVYRKEPETVRRTAEGWFIDMGEEITGALGMSAVLKDTGSGSRCDTDFPETGEVIIRCGEELNGDGSVRCDMRCNCKYEERWTLRGGVNHLEPYDYKGFRYARIICGPETEIRDIHAVVRHYPMDESLCTLQTDAPWLEGIFSICKKGVKYGTQEAYLDCPTREKGQYLGDAVVSARAQVWLTGKTDLMRKCIDQFAQTSRICPGLMAVAPGSLMQEIADFSLLWSELLLTEYEFTGDRDFLGRYYPAAKGILEHFRQYAGEDGLLCQVADKWNLVDWPENLRDGYDFPLTRPVVAPGSHNVINALYVGAAKNLSRIEKILGLPETYDWKSLKEAFACAFFSRETGLFRDSRTSAHSALHSNIYPLYFGLCPEGTEEKISDFLIKRGLSCGVMVSFFYLKALARAGRYEEMYRTLVNESDRGWVNMLREGATTCWEAWGKEQKWNTSLCHPWASAPVAVLIEEVAGFHPDPDSPGGYRFEPHIPESVQNFQLRFPFGGENFTVWKEDGKTRLVKEGKESR